MTAHVVTGALMALGCGLLGAGVPTVVARLPEPAPREVNEAESDEAGTDDDVPRPPKERYADLARRPRLASQCALAATVAGGACGVVLGASGVVLAVTALVPIGVALAVVDWRTLLLPTRLIAPAYVVVLALLGMGALLDGDAHPLLGAFYGWATWGLVFLLLWLVHPRGMGYGDVRLSGLLGLPLGYLGWPQVLTGLYAAFIIGAVAGLVLRRIGLTERNRFPFGPFMLLGALVGVLAGPAVLHALGY